MSKTASAKLVDKKIRVVLGCNFSILSEGITKLLEQDREIEIIAIVNNLLDLIEVYKNGSADIFLIDFELPGFELYRVSTLIKRNKDVKFLMILNKDYEEDILVEIISAGASGYILRQSDSEHLKKAIKAVYNNELWVERKILTRVVKEAISKGKENLKDIDNKFIELTETESKIVKLVLQGFSNRNIADHLFLSEKTVKFHLYKIFKKLSVKSRSELILFCFKNRLIS